jgi:DNA polymerase-1
LEEAKDYIERYFLTHKGVKNFIEETLNDAREKGYVRTFFGRKRPIPEIKSKDLNKRLQGERYAVNTVIQGTAADIIKLAMIKIWNKMISYGLRSRMILQIHDELVFEVKEEDVDVIKDIIKMEMEGVVEFLVPLSVEIKYGKNWAEAHA